jgi:hypothetical protein
MECGSEASAPTSAISSRREHTPQALHSPKTPPKHHQHRHKHTPTLTTETHTTNATPHLQPNTTPHRQFSALHPHTPHHPRTRHLFTNTSHRTLHNTSRTVHRARPRHPPPRTTRPLAPRTIPAPHQRPIHPRTPRHAPLPAVKTPARLLPQPKPALHPTKPHLHLPTLPHLQQQHLQRHRQLPPVRAVRNRVHPKRHQRAGFAPLGALGMPTHDNHEKHPLAPSHPTTRTFNLHPQVHLTPPHHKRHPLPPRALLPLVFGCPHLVALHPPTPPPRRRPCGKSHQRESLRVRTQQTVFGNSSVPNALVSPRPSPTHSSSCSGRPAALSHARTRCRLAIQPCYFGAARGGVGIADKGTSLGLAMGRERTLFRPHPQPLSHAVGEGCRGARRCALLRVPPPPDIPTARGNLPLLRLGWGIGRRRRPLRAWISTRRRRRTAPSTGRRHRRSRRS